MSSPQLTPTHDYVSRSVEVFIRIILMSIVAVSCFLIVKPFIPIIAWAIIISIATFPAYELLRKVLGGKQVTAAVVYSLILLAALIIPAVLMTGTLVEGIQSLAAQLNAGTLAVPPPPAAVEKWPIIGKPLTSIWALASSNLAEVVRKFSPQIQAFVPKLLSISAAVGMTALQFVLSILLAGFMLSNATANRKFARMIFDRIFGDKADEFEELAGATIRSVTNGVVGVAIIQSIFASIGFVVVGLPGAGLWSAIFLVAAVLQAGFLALVPAVAYAFAITSTTHAVIFLIWCAIVGAMDNVLKPILLGRGSKVPIGVIFVGVIGGFMTMGIIGLFIGAIILSVGYKLFQAWVQGDVKALAEPEETQAASS
jgi:predicted PurR-regulated permease PerM